MLLLLAGCVPPTTTLQTTPAQRPTPSPTLILQNYSTATAVPFTPTWYLVVDDRTVTQKETEEMAKRILLFNEDCYLQTISCTDKQIRIMPPFFSNLYSPIAWHPLNHQFISVYQPNFFQVMQVLYSAEGGLLNTLTQPDRTEFGAMWSPTGMQIAFSRSFIAGNTQSEQETVIKNAQTAEELILRNQGFVDWINEREVLLVKDGFLLQYNLESQEQQKILPNYRYFGSSALSPDKKWLSFNANLAEEDFSQTSDTYLYNMESQTLITVLENVTGTVYWLPNSQGFLYYWSETAFPHSYIFYYDIAHSSHKLLLENCHLIADAISPDGAYTFLHCDKTGEKVFLYDIARNQLSDVDIIKKIFGENSPYAVFRSGWVP
jgi:Tol biopolymer transport system component